MINMVIEELETYMYDEVAPGVYRDESLHVFSLLKIQMLKDPLMYVKETNGKQQVIKSQKGLKSGWMFTAMLGSIFSWVYYWIANDCSTYGFKNMCTQGDDGVVFVPNLEFAVNMYANMTKYGIPINSRKSSTSLPGKLRQIDFLNRIVLKNGKETYITGVPIRPIHSLLWRSDWKMGGDKRSECARIVESFSTISRRSGSPFMYKECYNEIYRSTKYPKKDIKVIVHAVTAQGGNSLEPYIYDKKIVWEKETENELDKVHIPSDSISQQIDPGGLWTLSRLVPKKERIVNSYKIVNEKYNKINIMLRRDKYLTVRTQYTHDLVEKTQEEINRFYLEKDDIKENWNKMFNVNYNSVKHMSFNLLAEFIRGFGIKSGFQDRKSSSLGLAKIRSTLDASITNALLFRPRASIGTMVKLQTAYQTHRYPVLYFGNVYDWRD
jgi:hypothetical protein